MHKNSCETTTFTYFIQAYSAITTVINVIPITMQTLLLGSDLLVTMYSLNHHIPGIKHNSKIPLPIWNKPYKDGPSGKQFDVSWQCYWSTSFTQVLEIMEFENLVSRPGLFAEILESPGIWTYRSIFLIKRVQEISRYTSSEMSNLITTTNCMLLTYSVCVSSMSVHCSAALIENMCIFRVVRSWNFTLGSPGIWDLKMCMSPDLCIS